jgi:flagellar biosynthesis protein FliQ
MTSEQITQIVRQTLFISLEIAAPFLLLALIIGVIISLVQSVTQMQEMTLAFVPKMIVVAATLGFFFPWMLKMLTKFTNNLLIYQWEKVTSFMHYVQ